MPIPSGTLGHEPQRLRTVVRDQKGHIGVDAFGKGGAEIVKDMVDAGNGVLFGIGDVLEPPPTLGKTNRSMFIYLGLVLNLP